MDAQRFARTFEHDARVFLVERFEDAPRVVVLRSALESVGQSALDRRLRRQLRNLHQLHLLRNDEQSAQCLLYARQSGWTSLSAQVWYGRWSLLVSRSTDLQTRMNTSAQHRERGARSVAARKQRKRTSQTDAFCDNVALEMCGEDAVLSVWVVPGELACAEVR